MLNFADGKQRIIKQFDNRQSFMRNTYQTTVFISHNSKDKPFVHKLAKALKARNIKCWVDEAEMRFGESLVHKISEAINEINLVIAVISNNSVFSNWVRQELDWV